MPDAWWRCRPSLPKPLASRCPSSMKSLFRGAFLTYNRLHSLTDNSIIGKMPIPLAASQAKNEYFAAGGCCQLAPAAGRQDR